MGINFEMTKADAEFKVQDDLRATNQFHQNMDVELW